MDFEGRWRTRLLEIGNGSAIARLWRLKPAPDELDRIQNANDRDYAMSNLERNSSRLGEVRTALHRIALGYLRNLRWLRREHQSEAPGRGSVDVLTVSSARKPRISEQSADRSEIDSRA